MLSAKYTMIYLKVKGEKLDKNPILFAGDFNLNIRDNNNGEFLNFMSNIGYEMMHTRLRL